MNKPSGKRDAELRGLVPVDLLQKLDAIMQADGLDNRMDVVIPCLEMMVERRIHSATLLLRMCKRNPTDSET
jgi:hypothetical protein